MIMYARELGAVRRILYRFRLIFGVYTLIINSRVNVVLYNFIEVKKYGIYDN